jgi:hypothetical protein
MKKFYPIILFLQFLLTGAMAFAQQTGQPVRFVNGNFITGSNISKQSFTVANLQPSLFGGDYFVLVQFDALPDASQKEILQKAGIHLGDYFPGNAYLATIKKDIDFSSFPGFNISSVNPIPSLYKIDQHAIDYKPALVKENDKLFALRFYPGINRSAAIPELQAAGAVIVPTKFDAAGVVFIQPDKNIINRIAAIPFVSYIQLQTITDKILNYKAIGLHGLSGLQCFQGRNLSGRNVAVGIGDNAEITTHADFTGRVINRVYNLPSLHGIHTSGTVAGAGNVDPRYHGMAPKATIVSQWFSDVITNTPVYVTDYNMIATNNSYTAADDGCIGNGIYDDLSNYADVQMKNYPTVLHVFSAGNDGTYTCAPYPAAYGTIKTGWQCAKNVLTVGAMNQANNTIANFSSRGPVLDGRLKPEIVASGVNVISTNTLNRYVNNSGTSMSGPVVAGAVTILNERYRQLNGGSTAKAALIKALLCNNAEDYGNPGPDYTFGFGMLNARRAVEAMEGNRYFISTTTPSTQTISVPAGVRRLKVMLYWADPAAAPNAANTLVNDLDLTVTDGLSNTYLPLILNPGNVTANAVPGVDHVNNIEQVVIDNPAAGNYNLNVSAFAVPQGPQEYVLTYMMEMNGVTVEYPFGGETWVPGETETIRWNAFGDEANTFSVDTSFDNGLTWGTLNNNVAANARSLNWVVPTTTTNNAFVRVRRNSSVYTDQSDFSFVVLGQPVVTAAVPCEGYVQLDWAAIPSATSYDILQLKGDSMSLIGNTAGLTYLVSGLSSTTSYWFGVAAKNNAFSGRRSLSKNITPATGTCTLSGFDNNFKAVSIDAPVTGRQFTTGALTSAETIKLTIKNLDNITSSGTYNLYYQVNANAPVMESSAVAITSLGTYQYSFVQTFDFSATGIYTIRAWVKNPGDTQPLDDTVFITIKNLANPPVTLPVADGFETALVKDYLTNTKGLDSIDRVDFKTNSTRGRARTFVNTGFARTGNRAITLDQFPVGSLVTDSLLLTYNAATYNSGNQLRFDFYYRNHGQANNPDNKVWIRGSDADNWVLAYDLVANQGGLGQWKHGVINVNDVLGPVVPAQNITTSFQIKFGQEGNTSANVANPELDQDDGYTFDDISLSEALNDVAIVQVLSPSITGCNMNGTHPVSIQIKNYSATPFSNVPVYYTINGGAPVTELIPFIGPNSTQTFTFATNATLANNTDYSFNIWVKAPSDNYSSNDSVINYTFHTSPVINSFPYLEGFESNDGNWYAKGTNNSWAWGTPAKTVINKAANGTKAWVTSLTGNYKNNELSYLYSPCFDLSGLTQPVLSFSHIFLIEDNCPCDYTWVEYSTDGGVTWNKLGTNGAGVNWYNDPTFLNQWRYSLTTWHVASLDIPTTGSNVRFRFVMSSDAGFNTEGVGVDDIHIFDKAPVYTGPTLLNTTQAVSGSNWIHFTSGGTRIASINPNGQNLGSTTVDVYPYSGSVRYQNAQYYLNRNIVIRPAIQPASNVSVRFYFTDTEAKNLIAASGCSICSKLTDPYQLGVTKYSGTALQENGTLSDNLPGGSYIYVLPANTDIIPYDNGYYAEFAVNSFSEFWLNNGGAGGNTPLPLHLISFEAIKQDKISVLQWSTDNELNTLQYVVERSKDGTNFSVIGQVQATNLAGTNTYHFNDVQPFAGFNFYRLKLVDRDGSFKYSPTRKIDFSVTTDDITIYPNPVRDAKLTIASTGNCNSELIYDAEGKLVRSFALRGRDIILDLSGIAKGIYQLKIVTDNAVQTKKIIIQ